MHIRPDSSWSATAKKRALVPSIGEEYEPSAATSPYLQPLPTAAVGYYTARFVLFLDHQ